MTKPARYTRTAIALHWLLALALLGLLAMGTYMTSLPFSPARLKLYNWHKWAGILVLALSVARLAWRLTHRPPAGAPMPGWQRQAARAAHAALYLLFFAVPLAGWTYSSAAGFPVVLFGLWPLPDLVAADRALAETLKAVHGALAWSLLAVIVLHVAGALKHQLIDRDGLLLRMLPQRA